MHSGRRKLLLMAGAALLPISRAHSQQSKSKRISLVLAPSNLGLRPTESGGEPGTWRAPEVLMAAGLERAVDAAEVVLLQRPTYEFGAQAGTRIRNGQSLRTFLLELSAKVRDVLDSHRFPLVIGGDCSVLLGGLYGLRLAGGRGLVHIDGHSDFSHPGNYDSAKILGAAAGMDLALASGRGEPTLTTWPKIDTPLAADADIVQIGERNYRDPIFMRYYGDILRTDIMVLAVQSVLAEGIDAAAKRVISKLAARSLDKVWMHVDLDVLDQAVMSAVDSAGSPGFNYSQLAALISALRESGRIAGATVSIYDPERDPGTRFARPIVECIAAGMRGPTDFSVSSLR